MAEYHVGCGLTAIYAGTINKDKTLWKSRTDCTEEAIEAVRDYLVRECLGGFDCKKKTTGGYTWGLVDGRELELRVTIWDPKQELGSE